VYNKYDNIDEIKRAHPLSREELERIAKGKTSHSKHFIRIKRTLYIYDVDYFLYRLHRLKSFRLPFWKVVIPSLDNRNIGAIYYFVRGKPSNLLFRATFGYWGTGPHEAAKIEQFVEHFFGDVFEVRDGDLLIQLISQ